MVFIIDRLKQKIKSMLSNRHFGWDKKSSKMRENLLASRAVSCYDRDIMKPVTFAVGGK
jgi:hypothetical protein